MGGDLERELHQYRSQLDAHAVSPVGSCGSSSRSLSHARSAPPALKMMGITIAGAWAFTIAFARV